VAARDEGQALERIGPPAVDAGKVTAPEARARVQRDVLRKVEGLEAALLRVPGHRDHLVGVGAVGAGVVAEPELHVSNLPPVRSSGGKPLHLGRGLLRAEKQGRLRELLAGVQAMNRRAGRRGLPPVHPGPGARHADRTQRRCARAGTIVNEYLLEQRG